MNLTSSLRVAAVSALLALPLLAACSSDDDSKSSSSTSSGASALNCSTSGTTTSCTTAETTEYSNCVQNACDSQYKECLGPNYKTGSYGGVCQTYMECISKCGCEQTCRTKCGTPQGECQTCFTKFGTCTQTCSVPACYTSGTKVDAGGSTSGAGCADLQTCCNAMTGSDKDGCLQAYSGVKSSEAACSALLNNYKTSKKC